MLMGFVFVIIGITFYQEQKTERALEALRDLSSPRALVIRDGRQQRIAGREVVRDDIVLIAEGDRVPADAVLLSGSNVSVDESLLTGESVPVRKKAWDGRLEMGRPGGDDLPFVYSGTLVVKGQGIAQVRTTGLRTEIGKIGKALQILEPEDTNLQQQTGQHRAQFCHHRAEPVRCWWWLSFGLTRGDWLHGFLAGITLAMATLPEEFPVVLTIFLALGAWRISQRQGAHPARAGGGNAGRGHGVVRGQNRHADPQPHDGHQRMAVGRDASTWMASSSPCPRTLHEVVEYSILASPADPFDPMEKAMKELGGRTLANTEHLHKDWSWCENIRSPRNCWPCRMSGSRRMGRSMSSPPRARPKPSPTCATFSRSATG